MTSAELATKAETGLPDGAGRGAPRGWAIALLAIIVVAAGWLRFADLGRLSFWADEFPHAIAARSLIHDGRPLLPSGREYRRAYLQTIAVAGSMRVFGENERAARLPSSAVGLLTVIGVWLVARRRFGDVAALAGAAALAVLPLHVAHSRSARFYAAFALAYFAAAVLGTRALESRSKRTTAAAVVAFGLALHMQIEAATLLLPLICYAVYLRAVSPEHHASLGRTAGLLAAIGAGAVLVIVVVPPLREGAAWLIDHLPGLRLKPGIHLDTLGKLFGVVSWWAWMPLAPAAIAGLRRAERAGVALALNLLVPAVALAVLFAPTTERGISSRYLFYLFPFLATVVGIGAAQLLSWAARRDGAPQAIVAAVLASAIIAGGPTVWKLPASAHPGKAIPRPNWDAATTVVMTLGKRGDAIVSTSPLAPAWALGRCADWIREAAAAETFLEDGRDIYCRSEFISDDAKLSEYLQDHPRGWVIADPAQWNSVVDPAARAHIERIATPVAVEDRTILVFRWGG
jgi:4-amino-4-deoxy-L-arabinose transferase-like glycosyltransferase